MLKTADPAARVAATKTLEDMASHARAAIPALTQALKDQDPSVRNTALKALRAMAPESKEAFMEISSLAQYDPDPLVKTRAAETKEALLIAPDDPPGFFEASGAQSSVQSPVMDLKVQEALEDLKDDNELIRSYALFSLRQNAAKAQPAIQAVEQVAQNDPSEEIRNLASETLDVIQRAAESPPPARDTSPEEDVRSAMEDLKSSDPFTRYAAALILKKKGAQAQPAVPLLRELAQDDPDPEVRQAASRAADAIQGTDAATRAAAAAAQEPELARVIALLQNPDAERRKLAALYLRNLGLRGTQAVPALIQALDDRETNVRMAAISALGRMLPESERAFPKIAQIAMQENAPAEIMPEVLLAVLTAEAMQSVPPDLAPEKGERAVLDYALEQLDHQEASRRWTAATALPFLGGPANEILPILENLARNDPEESVRSIAAMGVEAVQREQSSGTGDQALGSSLAQEPAPLTQEVAQGPRLRISISRRRHRRPHARGVPFPARRRPWPWRVTSRSGSMKPTTRCWRPPCVVFRRDSWSSRTDGRPAG